MRKFERVLVALLNKDVGNLGSGTPVHSKWGLNMFISVVASAHRVDLKHLQTLCYSYHSLHFSSSVVRFMIIHFW